MGSLYTGRKEAVEASEIVSIEEEDHGHGRAFANLKNGRQVEFSAVDRWRQRTGAAAGMMLVDDFAVMTKESFKHVYLGSESRDTPDREGAADAPNEAAGRRGGRKQDGGDKDKTHRRARTKA